MVTYSELSYTDMINLQIILNLIQEIQFQIVRLIKWSINI